ncbi:MAG: DNA repair protein RadC [Alphaproteobacteria bacterium]
MADSNPPMPADMNKPDAHYQGHRARLRDRFMKDFGSHMADYEMLELLLCVAIPRRDVKPLAKELLKRFGSLGGVFAASPADLKEHKMIGDQAAFLVKLVQSLSLSMLKQGVEQSTILSSWQAVLDYCRTAMAYEKIEQLRILFLNNRNQLIADEVPQKGTVNHTPIYPREIAKRALELGATALILVHNHPSGDATPSGEDIEMTKRVKNTLAPLEIYLHDHIIIAGKDYVSMKTLGLI